LIVVCYVFKQEGIAVVLQIKVSEEKTNRQTDFAAKNRNTCRGQ